MKFLYQISILLAFLLMGCKASLKKEYAIKDPQLENRVSINNFLSVKGIDASNIYVFRNLMTYAQASNQKILNIPDAIFFNEKGHFVTYKKTAQDCNAKIEDFLLDLDNFSQLPSDPTKSMDNLSSLITNNTGKNLLKSDITVFITWAVFAGKLNDEKAFNWVKLLDQAKAKGINVNYYLLNCDFQEEWNLTTEQKQSLGILK